MGGGKGDGFGVAREMGVGGLGRWGGGGQGDGGGGAREMGVGGGVGVYIVFSFLSIQFYPNSH